MTWDEIREIERSKIGFINRILRILSWFLPGLFVFFGDYCLFAEYWVFG